MKRKRLINILLLLVLSLSFTHEYTVSLLNQDHCSADEISQIEIHDEVEEICNSHSEFHTAYVLADLISAPFVKNLYLEAYSEPLTYNFKSTDYFLKPPIA